MVSCIKIYLYLLSAALRSTHSSSMSSGENTPRDSRGNVKQNDEYHWKRGLDQVLKGIDLCKNGPNDYGQCKMENFPSCKSDERICMYRQPRTDLFFDKNHYDPAYYIDYDHVECVPDWNAEEGRKWNCNLCDPGKWCPSLNRCVKHKKRFCPDWCGKGTRWCPSARKCKRFRDVNGKKKERCPDKEWHKENNRAI